jgi:hypothetical protein
MLHRKSIGYSSHMPWNMENNGTAAPQYLHVFLDFVQHAMPQVPWLLPQAQLLS